MVPNEVHKYSKYDERKRQFVCPEHDEFVKFRLVVTTLQTARSLKLKKFDNGYFTHIFLDEAAQALESEAIIPLSLASSKKTKLILAGDKMQTNSPVYSQLARKYGLDRSLLERLYDDAMYKKGIGISCCVELNENRRSHKDVSIVYTIYLLCIYVLTKDVFLLWCFYQILEVPSKLFYSGSLKAMATFPQNGPKGIPHMRFQAVDGEEKQDDDSPSFYNVFEAQKVVEQVMEFCQGGLQQKDICVLTLYRRQLTLIRQLLRRKGKVQVQVLHIDGVQGQEYRALILCTVRTCTVEPNEGEDSTFLSNPKVLSSQLL
jgi:superfamily I DNA and/or RNA helicase